MKRILTASIIIAISLIVSPAAMAQDITQTCDSGEVQAKTFAPVSPYISPRLYGTYPIDYRWGHYYSPYGRISREDIIDYIGYSLYGSEYMKASNRYVWGIHLTGAGASAILISIATHIAYAGMDRFSDRHGMSGHSTDYSAGIAVGYIAGAACLGAGIPLWVKGSKGLRKIADDYNRRYINPEENGTSPNLSLGATRNGIGLAFNF